MHTYAQKFQCTKNRENKFANKMGNTRANVHIDRHDRQISYKDLKIIWAFFSVAWALGISV